MTGNWEKLDMFQLPQISENEQASASLIEQKLIDANNYMAYLSQFEPGLKSDIDAVNVEILEIERKISNYILDGQLSSIPQQYSKNKELVYAYITRQLYKDEIEQLEKEKQEKRKAIQKLNGKYNRLERMLKQLKITLDTGRSILSALKEEMRHSDL